VHRFSFASGAVSYANKYLETPNLRAIRDEGKIKYSEFATDPCRSLFARFFTMFQRRKSANPCVNVVPIGGKLSGVSETPIPVEFDTRTLSTAGVVDYTDDLKGQVTTAHPHQDPGTGDLVNYLVRFSRQSTYRVYRQPTGSSGRTLIGEIPTERPGYMHSFAITENHVVLAVFPLVVNPLSFVLSGRPFIDNYRWNPELGTKFIVMSLRDGSIRGTYETEPLFAFHHINAWEDGGELTVDLCAYQDSTIVDALRLEHLRDDGFIPVSYPTRCRIDLDGGSVEVRRLAEEPLELPRVDYERHNGREYRFAYGVGSRHRDGSDFLDQLVKLDAHTGECRTWYEDGCYAGEPVFVPGPHAEAEDDGVILSVVLDSRTERSFMLTLDASSFSELARAEVPHGIPFGFHGLFLDR
jgi:beta,beta-carotene 9',10'-dioxygenase